MVTRGQMVPGGDFETTFSFTFKGMCDLFDATYGQYQHSVNDPEEDGNSRGVRGASFETPTQENLEELFNVMHRFVCNYLEIYYPRNATGANDVRNDTETLEWLEELNALRSQRTLASTRKVHLGQVGADAGGPAVLGDRAARDPGQFYVELSAVDAPPAAREYIRISSASHWTFTSAWSTQTTS